MDDRDLGDVLLSKLVQLEDEHVDPNELAAYVAGTLPAAEHERLAARIERDPEAIIRQLDDLQPGSPVVNAEYGVGRYLGLMTLETGGIEAVLEGVGVAELTAARPRGPGGDLDRWIGAGAGVVTGLFTA